MSDPAGLSRANSAEGRLQRAAFDVMREHERDGALPTSIRFVFYVLEQRGEASKSERAANLSEALMRLRELGLVPWTWIVDETRTLTDWDSAETVVGYLRDRVDEARVNPWPGPAPLILTESESLAGVLRALTYDYVCPIAATRGQVGGFLHTEVGPFLESARGRKVLYLGDLDLSGGQIETNTRRVLEQEILSRALDWTRVAITEGQVAERDLEPIAKKDKRYKPARPYKAWETEALGQQTVVALVREALDALLPGRLTDVRVREAAERTAIARVLEDGADGT
jgi:hypothetical protein